MKSLTALQKAAIETGKASGPMAIQELADICTDLVLHVEALQRQIDEMRRHDNIRRRAGSN